MANTHLYWDGFTKSASSDIAGKVYQSLFENAKSGKWSAVFSTLVTSDSRLTQNRRAINACELDSIDCNSLLHYAAYMGAAVEIVEKLIALGALRSLRNKSNQKPLDIAKSQSHTHLFEILEPVHHFEISVPDLQQIEQNFHDVILKRENGSIGQAIKAQSLRLPQLEPLLELDVPEGWFPIPGYMGGFEYWLRVNDDPIRLICQSGSRMDLPGQEQLHEITTEGSRLLAREDAKDRFILYLNLKKDIQAKG